MNIFILTGGDKDIGFGHVIRCISIGEAFEERGIRPKFIVKGDESVKGLFRDKAYRIFDWLKRPEILFDLVKNPDVLIIDSYSADLKFYKMASEIAGAAVYMDDYKRLAYPQGIVVNGNIYATRLSYPRKDAIDYLLGTAYIPLRREFLQVPQKKINRSVENLMLTCGGADSKDLTPKILKFLNRRFPHLIKKVIIGEAFKERNKTEIKKLKEKTTELIFYPDAKRMKEVMLASDIAISAGGQTLYELARVGTPTVGFCIAENQRLILEGWHKTKFSKYIGWYRESGILDRLEKALSGLLISYAQRKRLSAIGRYYVDGRGSKRIVGSVLDRIYAAE